MNEKKLCEGCDKCNQKAPLFKHLSKEELEIVNRDRYSVSFHEGEVILKQGIAAKSIISPNRSSDTSRSRSKKLIARLFSVISL